MSVRVAAEERDSVSPSASTAELAPGAVVEGRYEVVRKIGAGSFATVYEVRHLALKSRHALKLLAVDPRDEELRRRFLAEGRIQAQLRHPNLASVTEIVTEPAPGLVMEYVDGPTLEHYLAERGRLSSAEEILELMVPLLDAVGSAHAQGIVHRDLKPQNIIIGRDGQGRIQPKVVDFGIAKVLNQSAVHVTKAQTRAGAKMGTLLYMSPEQIRDPGAVDAKSDVFALGAILYEVVTGRLAFDAKSDFDIMRRIVDGTFTPPRSLVKELEPRLAACIKTALAVNPAHRFVDCARFQGALQNAFRPRESAAAREERQEDAPAPAPPAPARSVSGAAKAQAGGSGSVTLAILFGLCLPGGGQLYNGQIAKSLLLSACFGLSFFGSLWLEGAFGGGRWWLPPHRVGGFVFQAPLLTLCWSVSLVDGFAVARRRQLGKEVGPWTWF